MRACFFPLNGFQLVVDGLGLVLSAAAAYLLAHFLALEGGGSGHRSWGRADNSGADDTDSSGSDSSGSDSGSDESSSGGDESSGSEDESDEYSSSGEESGGDESGSGDSDASGGGLATPSPNKRKSTSWFSSGKKFNRDDPRTPLSFGASDASSGDSDDDEGGRQQRRGSSGFGPKHAVDVPEVRGAPPRDERLTLDEKRPLQFEGLIDCRLRDIITCFRLLGGAFFFFFWHGMWRVGVFSENTRNNGRKWVADLASWQVTFS